MINKKLKVWIICLVLVVLVGGFISGVLGAESKIPTNWDTIEIDKLTKDKLDYYNKHLDDTNRVNGLVEGVFDNIVRLNFNYNNVKNLFDNLKRELVIKIWNKIMKEGTSQQIGALNNALNTRRASLTRIEELLKVALTKKEISGQDLTIGKKGIGQEELDQAAESIIKLWADEGNDALGKHWYNLYNEEKRLRGEISFKNAPRPMDSKLLSDFLSKLSNEQKKVVMEYTLKKIYNRDIKIGEKTFENAEVKFMEGKKGKPDILEITKNSKTYQIPLQQIPESITEIGILDPSKGSNRVQGYDGVYYKDASENMVLLGKGYLQEETLKDDDESEIKIMVLRGTGLKDRQRSINPILNPGKNGAIYFNGETFQMWGKDADVEIEGLKFFPDPKSITPRGNDNGHYAAFEIENLGVYRKIGPGRLKIHDILRQFPPVTAIGNSEQGVLVDFTGTKANADISFNPPTEGKKGTITGTAQGVDFNLPPKLESQWDVSKYGVRWTGTSEDQPTPSNYAATSNGNQYVNRNGNGHWEWIRTGRFLPGFRWRRRFVYNDASGGGTVTNSESSGHWVRQRQRVRGRIFPRRIIPKYRMVWVPSEGSSGGGGGGQGGGVGRVGEGIRGVSREILVPTGSYVWEEMLGDLEEN